MSLNSRIRNERIEANGRDRLSKFVLLTFSILLSLLAVELFLRLFYPTPFYGYLFVPPQMGLFQYDPLLGWRGRANASGQFAANDFIVTVNHDANGFRNLARPFVDGKRNILVLGDSFAWGWGVEADEVFSARIMKLEPGLNLYSVSAPGYGTDQEYLALKDFLTQNDHPYDGLVLLFVLNDFKDVGATVRYSYPKPMFELDGNALTLVNVPVPDTKREELDQVDRQPILLEGGWLHRFHTYNLLVEKGPLFLATITGGSAAEESDAQTHPAEPSSEELKEFEIAFRLLMEIAALAKDRGMFFHVVTLESAKPDPELWRLPALHEFLEEEGIPFSHFKGQTFPATDLWLDGHPSAYGHRLLARHVLEQAINAAE